MYVENLKEKITKNSNIVPLVLQGHYCHFLIFRYWEKTFCGNCHLRPYNVKYGSWSENLVDFFMPDTTFLKSCRAFEAESKYAKI